jgi:hypothetical protein
MEGILAALQKVNSLTDRYWENMQTFSGRLPMPLYVFSIGWKLYFCKE